MLVKNGLKVTIAFAFHVCLGLQPPFGLDITWREVGVLLAIKVPLGKREMGALSLQP